MNSEIQIVDYESKYHAAFKALNVEWISTYFKMEASDYKALDHPQEYIIDKGGCIKIALYHDEPVGACALIKMNDDRFDFELAKMAVSPAMQGKKIGEILGKAIIEKAKELGGKSLYLESNTVLEPAMRLYSKLGFKKIEGILSPYERCNIQMELEIV